MSMYTMMLTACVHARCVLYHAYTRSVSALLQKTEHSSYVRGLLRVIDPVVICCCMPIVAAVLVPFLLYQCTHMCESDRLSCTTRSVRYTNTLCSAGGIILDREAGGGRGVHLGLAVDA